MAFADDDGWLEKQNTSGFKAKQLLKVMSSEDLQDTVSWRSLDKSHARREFSSSVKTSMKKTRLLFFYASYWEIPSGGCFSLTSILLPKFKMGKVSLLMSPRQLCKYGNTHRDQSVEGQFNMKLVDAFFNIVVMMKEIKWGTLENQQPR